MPESLRRPVAETVHRMLVDRTAMTDVWPEPVRRAGRAYSAVFRASALLPIELCTLKLTASER